MRAFGDIDARPVVVRRVRETGGNAVAVGLPRLVPFASLTRDAAGLLTTREGEALIGRAAAGTASAALVVPARIAAQPTRRVVYSANLPRICAGGTLDPRGFTHDPTTDGGGGVTADDAARFTAHSISGGSVRLVSAGGVETRLALRFARVCRLPGRPERWNLFHACWAGARGTEFAWRNVGADYLFSASGMAEGELPEPCFDALVEGRRHGALTLSHGPFGLTQLDDASGLVRVRATAGDGLFGGELGGFGLDAMGRLLAVYGGRSEIVGIPETEATAARAA